MNELQKTYCQIKSGNFRLEVNKTEKLLVGNDSDGKSSARGTWTSKTFVWKISRAEIFRLESEQSFQLAFPFNSNSSRMLRDDFLDPFPPSVFSMLVIFN